LHGWPEQWHS